jgi:Zn-finger nucleic acid-binding protein
MSCPSCGAPMRLDENKDYFECCYCKSLYVPNKNEDGVQVLGEPASLGCPVCAVPLVHAAAAGMRFLYCVRCRGMLVPMSIFVALVEDYRAQLGAPSIVQSPADSRDLRRRLNCPCCHGRMDTHPYYGPGNVVIDSCSKCFVNWLDHNELMRVVRSPDRHFRSERLPLSAEPEP